MVRAPSLYLGGSWFESRRAYQNIMPFLFIGIILLGVGIFFLRKSIREEDKEGVVGVMALIIAAVFLIVFFGLFYTLTIF